MVTILTEFQADQREIPHRRWFSVGFRIANRDIDQNFGRYLINGTLANGQIAGNSPSSFSKAASRFCRS